MTNLQLGTRMASMLMAVAACGSAQAATITDWNFGTLPVTAAPDNSPAPTTGAGTITSLGMTNTYTYSNNVTGATTADDITNDSPVGTANGSTLGNGDVWRIRGANPGNGWSSSAPQYSQGAEYDVSTAGYNGISLSFNWAATTQGVGNMQVQYTTNGSTWTNIGSIINATIDTNKTGTIGSGFATDTVDFSNVSGVSNDALFGVRLVSAYNATLGSQYASATSVVSGAPSAINNSSGNWRIADVQIDGTVATPVPLPDTAWLLMSGLVGFAALVRARKSDIGIPALGC